MQLVCNKTRTWRYNQSLANVEIFIQECCCEIHLCMKIIQVEGFESLHSQVSPFANIHEVDRRIAADDSSTIIKHSH